MKKLLVPALVISMLSGCVVVVGDVDDRPLEHFSRHLSIPVGSIERLDIEAGAGYLKVTGVEGLDSIEVDAEIWAHSPNENDYRLTLDGSGRSAELIAEPYRNKGFKFNVGGSARIDLTVRVPKHLMLDIDDGSGDMLVKDINGKVEIEDGSGRIDVQRLGDDLKVNDGSGEILIDDVAGNVTISDGSGNMYVKNVGKTLTIDDGSGDIEVSNIHELKIEESGSGDVSVNDTE